MDIADQSWCQSSKVALWNQETTHDVIIKSSKDTIHCVFCSSHKAPQVGLQLKAEYKSLHKPQTWKDNLQNILEFVQVTHNFSTTLQGQFGFKNYTV